VATSPRVYLFKEFYSFQVGDTAHKDARGSTLVHLIINENKSLGTASQSLCFGLVRGQGPIDEML